jgi:hypothetical protein
MVSFVDIIGLIYSDIYVKIQSQIYVKHVKRNGPQINF